jgi:hypothetical protein
MEPAAVGDLLLTIHHLPFTRQARVAQLDRAFDFESKGRRFEPCRAHHLLTKTLSGALPDANLQLHELF